MIDWGSAKVAFAKANATKAPNLRSSQHDFFFIHNAFIGALRLSRRGK